MVYRKKNPKQESAHDEPEPEPEPEPQYEEEEEAEAVPLEEGEEVEAELGSPELAEETIQSPQTATSRSGRQVKPTARRLAAEAAASATATLTVKKEKPLHYSPPEEFIVRLSWEEWETYVVPDVLGQVDPITGQYMAKGGRPGWSDFMLRDKIVDYVPCCVFVACRSRFTPREHRRDSAYFRAVGKCKRNCSVWYELRVDDEPIPGEDVEVQYILMADMFKKGLFCAPGQVTDPTRCRLKGPLREKIKRRMIESGKTPAEMAIELEQESSELAKKAGNYTNAPSYYVLLQLWHEIHPSERPPRPPAIRRRRDLTEDARLFSIPKRVIMSEGQGESAPAWAVRTQQWASRRSANSYLPSPVPSDSPMRSTEAILNRPMAKRKRRAPGADYSMQGSYAQTHGGKRRSLNNSYSPQRQMNPRDADEDEIFGLWVAAKLRKFSAEQNAIAKLKIQQFLYEMEFGAMETVGDEGEIPDGEAVEYALEGHEHAYTMHQ